MPGRFLKLIVICALSVIPNIGSDSLAQKEFRQSEPLVLSTKTRNNVNVRGYARGSVALFKTIGDRDINQRRCMGYGSITPDHVIELQEKATQLTLRVSSREKDTTLIIEGPKGELYCADDSPKDNKDAQMILNNARTGAYKVWIGSFEPGTGFRYSLSIRAQ